VRLEAPLASRFGVEGPLGIEASARDDNRQALAGFEGRLEMGLEVEGIMGVASQEAAGRDNMAVTGSAGPPVAPVYAPGRLPSLRPAWQARDGPPSSSAANPKQPEGSPGGAATPVPHSRRRATYSTGHPRLVSLVRCPAHVLVDPSPLAAPPMGRPYATETTSS
jgi:hypothetical protein